MSGVSARSKLFHAIVVVGLSSASAGCGGTRTVIASEGGNDARVPDPSDADAPSSSAEAGFEFGETDASEDAGVEHDGATAVDATLSCDAGSRAVGCWPTYV
jgi:hypothetical protein